MKNELLNYLIKCFEVYKDNNYEFLLDYVNSYNCRLNEYEKNISNVTNNIFKSITNVLSYKKIKYSYKESNKSIKINLIFSNNNYPTTPTNIIVPVFVENFLRISIKLINYLIDNKIDCNIKLSKINKIDLFVISIYDFKKAKEFMIYYSNDKEMSNDIKNKNNPLFLTYFGLSVYTCIKPFNFLDLYLYCLCFYFKNIKKSEDITINSLLEFLLKFNKKENNILKKEMINIIIKTININNSSKTIDYLFNYNANMNLGSFDLSSYNLKLDSNKLIFFENKEKTVLIVFGGEDYLNICYSKFYNNVIEKYPNDLLYCYFQNIFYKILEDKFENFENILDFSNSNEDIIYQELMLISSGYFGYKKIGIKLEIINNMIKIILEKKLNCVIKQEQENNNIPNDVVIFPFNLEYANKIIKLKSGKLSTVFNYFRDYYVLDYIPLKSKINLKNGSIVTGEEFLKNLYNIIEDYDDFKDLIDDQIEMIEILD